MEFHQNVFEWPLDRIIDGLCGDVQFKNTSKSRMFNFKTIDNRESLWQLELKSTVTGISVMLCLCSKAKNCFLADFEIDLHGSNNKNDRIKWASHRKKKTFSNDDAQTIIFSFVCKNALKYLHEQNFSFTIECRMNLKILECKIDSVPLSVPDFEDLMLNSEFSDLILIAAKSGKEFKLHRNILAARSKPLALLIKHSMRGSRQEIEIKIEGFDDDVIEELIRYIYCGRVKNLSELSTELLKAAEKFDIEGLKVLCLEDFCRSMTVKNACQILQLLHEKNLKDLKSQVLNFIAHNLQHIDRSAFEEFDCPDLLREVLFRVISIYTTNK